jgi:glycosyltransferase involved in cell wall biosynthesis
MEKDLALRGESAIPRAMLSVIIPVFNERQTIREAIRRVCAVDVPKQIVVVDDASTDGTRQILEALEKDAGEFLRAYPDNRLTFVYQPENRGKGAAIRAAIPRVDEPITIIQDADLEYDPADYPQMIEPILKGRADVVYGSRFSGTHRRVLFFWHAVGNKLLTLISNVFTNLNLTDMETGYKAFRSDILKGIPIRSDRFGFEPEITSKVAKLGCRIYEVPIDYHGRTYAEGKKIGFKDALAALYVILKYWIVEDLYGRNAAGLRTLRIMEGAGHYNSWLFKQCEPYLGKRVLEMGSGVGNITSFLLDRERLLATDVSDGHLRELEREYGGFPNVRVAKLDFNDDRSVQALARSEQVDTVLSMNVLEHIEHDRRALEGCFNVVESGGRLVLLVPAHSALYSDMDRNIEHFRRYDLGALRKMVEEVGFKVVQQRHLNMLGAIGWFVNGRILRRQLIPSRQLRIFDFAIKLLALETLFAPPFGLSILLVAEKPAQAPLRAAQTERTELTEPAR